MFSFEDSYYSIITIIAALVALIIISKTKKNSKEQFSFWNCIKHDLVYRWFVALSNEFT